MFTGWNSYGWARLWIVAINNLSRRVFCIAW